MAIILNSQIESTEPAFFSKLGGILLSDGYHFCYLHLDVLLASRYLNLVRAGEQSKKKFQKSDLAIEGNCTMQIMSYGCAASLLPGYNYNYTLSTGAYQYCLSFFSFRSPTTLLEVILYAFINKHQDIAVGIYFRGES